MVEVDELSVEFTQTYMLRGLTDLCLEYSAQRKKTFRSAPQNSSSPDHLSTPVVVIHSSTFPVTGSRMVRTKSAWTSQLLEVCLVVLYKTSQSFAPRGSEQGRMSPSYCWQPSYNHKRNQQLGVGAGAEASDQKDEKYPND